MLYLRAAYIVVAIRSYSASMNEQMRTILAVLGGILIVGAIIMFAVKAHNFGAPHLALIVGVGCMAVAVFHSR